MENRYHGGLWFRAENSPVDVGRTMDQAGELIVHERPDGKVGVHPGKFVEPDIRLTEDDIHTLAFDANRRRATTVLAVRGQFTDASAGFVIPASPSPMPGSAAAKKTRATFGRMLPASSGKPSPESCSLKTSRGTSIWEPPRSSQTFGQWATASRQACSARSKPVLLSYGEGSSLWPTPTAARSWNHTHSELSMAGLKFRNDPTRIGKQVALMKVSRIWTLLYLLAMAMGADRLGNFSFPFSRPLHIDLETGARYSPGDLTFNPNFSDWLMGWPVGWSEPGQPVTGWSRWLQQMRGELSRLPSRTV